MSPARSIVILALGVTVAADAGAADLYSVGDPMTSVRCGDLMNVSDVERHAFFLGIISGVAASRALTWKLAEDIGERVRSQDPIEEEWLHPYQGALGYMHGFLGSSLRKGRAPGPPPEELAKDRSKFAAEMVRAAEPEDAVEAWDAEFKVECLRAGKDTAASEILATMLKPSSDGKLGEILLGWDAALDDAARLACYLGAVQKGCEEKVLRLPE